MELFKTRKDKAFLDIVVCAKMIPGH